MKGPPTREFGRRRPDIQPSAPIKRSSHVALLLMGTFAIGGGAYALMPRENCQPPPGMATPAAPGTAAPAISQTGTACSSGSSWVHTGHSFWGGSSSRTSFFNSDNSSGRSSFGGLSDTGSGRVTRGGFGSFAHAFSAHFSGGG